MHCRVCVLLLTWLGGTSLRLSRNACAELSAPSPAADVVRQCSGTVCSAPQPLDAWRGRPIKIWSASSGVVLRGAAARCNAMQRMARADRV